MILLAFFVMVTTSYERTKRLLGTRRGDDVEEFTDEEYDAAAQESGRSGGGCALGKPNTISQFTAL